MALLHNILEDARKHKGHILIRNQQCLSCNTVLAVEITDKLGSRGEYWVVKDILWFPTGVDFLYAQEVWFGNMITCPKCGRVGRLPIDKPLNTENIALPKEIKDGKTKDHVSTKAG